MGWFNKVVGTIADAAKVAAPVADAFFPGAGQAITAGANGVQQATGAKGTISELTEAGNWASRYITPITSGNYGAAAANILGSLGGDPNSIDPGFHMTGAAAANLLAGAGGANKGIDVYNNALAEAERLIAEDNYRNQLAEYQARSAFAASASAAASRAAAARNAAARQEEQNRLKASKKARKRLRKAGQAANKELRPYAQAGLEVLPVHTQLVNQGGALSTLLFNTLQQPAYAPRSDKLSSLLVGGM